MEFNMRKSIFIPSVLLIAFGIASPLIMGLVAENQFTSQLDKLSIENNTGMALSDIKFDRGYAQSDASFVMTLDDPNNGIPVFSVLFESKMQHTPINTREFGFSVFEIYSQDRISFAQGPEALVKFVNDNMEGYLLSGYSRTNALGRFDSVLSTAAIDVNNDEGELNIQMDSMIINSTGQIDGSETEFDMKLPSTNIKGADFSAQIKSISMIGDSRVGISGIPLGSILMEVAQVSVVSAIGNTEIKKIGFSTVSELIDNKIDTTVSYNVGSIEAPLPVSSASYNIDFNGLPLESAQLLQELQFHVNNMEANPGSTDKYFNQLLTATLQPGLQINQELKTNAFGGAWQADLDVEYVGIEGAELAEMKDPKVAIKGVAATLVVTADSIALSRSPLAPMLDGLMKQGFITLDNTRLTSNASLTAGKLMVNEVEIPVESIIDGILLQLSQSQEADIAAN
ncbi:MAG: hypothetical protein ACI9DG_000155 [Oleispira sp.]|jgi:hypothetical protein